MLLFMLLFRNSITFIKCTTISFKTISPVIVKYLRFHFIILIIIHLECRIHANIQIKMEFNELQISWQTYYTQNCMTAVTNSF